MSISEQIILGKDLAIDLLDAMPDGMVGINEEGSIVVFNKQASLMFGYCYDEAIGHKLDLLMPDQYKMPHVELVKQYFSNPQNRMMGHSGKEMFARRKNGEVFPVDISLNYLKTKDGLIALSSIRDISEQNKERAHRLLIEHILVEAQRIAQIGSWELNIKDNVLTWSDEIYKIFEIDQQTFGASYEAFLNAIHPDDRTLVNSAYTQSLANKTPYKIEHRLLMKDGRIKYVEEQCETQYDDKNEPLFSKGTLQDITNRKNIEIALKKSEQKLLEAQRIAQIGSWELDLATNETTWSEMQFIINGVPFSDKPVPQDLFVSLLHPDDKGWMLNKMQEAFEHGRSDAIYRIIRPNGEVRYLHGIAEVIYDNNGRPTKMFGTNQDISDRKNAEEILSLQNQQLKKTNEELDRFVYSASHDLRAPLTSLLGLIAITEIDYHNEPALKERLEMMKRTVNRLDSFIEDILDYSRNARTEIACELIDFDAKVNEIKELTKHLNEGTHHCELTIDLHIQSPFYSDRRRIWVILNNLISNAINYSDHEKKKCFVHVSIHTDEEKVVVKIEDNGKGIASQDLDKVFEMFYRASDKSKGSGLGLYIVKETVDKLNGSIELQSIKAPGKKSGTQFIITLPNLKRQQST